MSPVDFIRVTPGKTRKIKVIAATRVHGKHLDEGQVVEIPENDAYTLVHSSKAEFYVEPPKPPAEKGK